MVNDSSITLNIACLSGIIYVVIKYTISRFLINHATKNKGIWSIEEC
jgi:hypothetical protein